jgi:hypothetical protein
VGGQAAGHDEPEPVEIRRQVEREAVHGHPSRDAHADGADLRRTRRAAGLTGIARPRAGTELVGPHADQLRVALEEARVHAVGPANLDHHARQIADVAPHVAPLGAKIEDRVRHELTRTVIGDVAAAPRFLEVDAEGFEARAGGEHVLRLRRAAEGDDRLVLEQEERVAHVAPDPRVEEPLLQGVRSIVADTPEPVGGEASHRDRAARALTSESSSGPLR